MLAVRLPTKVISCLGLPCNQCRTIVESVHHALGPELCSKPSQTYEHINRRYAKSSNRGINSILRGSTLDFAVTNVTVGTPDG